MLMRFRRKKINIVSMIEIYIKLYKVLLFIFSRERGGLMNKNSLGKKIFILSLGTIIAAQLAISGCKPVTPTANYELHEWGVMEGCFTDDSVFVTSRPKIETSIKLPVIYIDAEGPMKISVKENIQEMTEPSLTITYPEAERSGKEISWNNVEVLSDKNSFGTPKLAVDERKTLEDIMPILNNVDSNTLKYNGKSSKFLFYEAEMKFENPIELSYDLRGVKVKNNGNYSVDSMVFVTSIPGALPFQDKLLAAKIGTLAPGEEKTVELSDFVREDNTLKEDLMKAGFTEKESESFSKLWSAQLFDTLYRRVDSQLAYKLPESEYDKLIPLTASPKPTNIERAMYVVLDASSRFNVTYEENELGGFFKDNMKKDKILNKEDIKKYTYALPEEAKEILLKSNPDEWLVGIDPLYREADITCQACGWICYTTPTPYEWKITDQNNGTLEIRIRDVQCFGLTPAFYYNGNEYLPQLPIPQPTGN